MKSYYDRSRSVRRATREESADAKRQRGEDGRPRPESAEKTRDIIVQIRKELSRIEGRLDTLVLGKESKLWMDKKKEEAKAEKVFAPDKEELFADLRRIETKVAKHSEIDERFLKRYAQQSSERKRVEKVLEEVRMERDILLEKVHSYLQQISSLKSKVEEQRCSVGAYERQVNAEYEIHLRKLESMNEDLRNMAMQKDKQLKDVNEQLRQMQKTLRSYEMLSWRKKNEESVFISILKNDLQTIWNDKIKMEEEFKRLKKQCGYMDDDNRWRFSSEEYMGSLLRRSKSMSDLTLEINAEGEDRQRLSATMPNTPSRCFKASHGIAVTEELSQCSEITTSSTRTDEQEEDKSVTASNPENVTKPKEW